MGRRTTSLSGRTVTRRAAADRVSSALALAALTASVSAVACGGSDEEAAARPILASESLVVGDWLGEAGLLVLPREGGRPELRTAADPSFVAWRGSSRLPRLESALVVDERSVLFRAPGGVAHRFDPTEDIMALQRGVDAVDGWYASGGRVALWSEEVVLVIGEGDSRAYTAQAPVAWAAAVPDAGVVALLETDGGMVLTALDESSEVLGQVDMEARPPGLTTAWGRSALLLISGGRQLVSVRLPELDVERRFDFRRPVTAISLSASSHEVYVALSGRIEAVDRVTGEGRKLADVDQEITELRAGIYGQQLLAFGGDAVFRISLTGDRPVRLDIDWRSDLPVGLPNGQILGSRGDSLYLVQPTGRSGDTSPQTPVEGPADAIWLPIRWSPVAQRDESPAETASRVATATGEEPERSGPDSVPAAESRPGEAEDENAEILEDPVSPSDSIGVAFGAPAAGYYTVAMASPEADGVVELVSALARSGYPTAIQRRRDDGGQLWYRALLGPYPARERAEAAARQLRRERGLDAWVTEVTAGTEGEF